MKKSLLGWLLCASIKVAFAVSKYDDFSHKVVSWIIWVRARHGQLLLVEGEWHAARTFCLYRHLSNIQPGREKSLGLEILSHLRFSISCRQKLQVGKEEVREKAK